MIKKMLATIIMLFVGAGVINEIGGQVWILQRFKFSDKQIKYIITHMRDKL